MEHLTYTQIFFSNLIIALIKSIGGGIGFAFIGLEIKKNWKKENKWMLALLFGISIFGLYIIFKGI